MSPIYFFIHFRFLEKLPVFFSHLRFPFQIFFFLKKKKSINIYLFFQTHTCTQKTRPRSGNLEKNIQQKHKLYLEMYK